jgi:hypothetical protein
MGVSGGFASQPTPWAGLEATRGLTRGGRAVGREDKAVDNCNTRFVRLIAFVNTVDQQDDLLIQFVQRGVDGVLNCIEFKQIRDVGDARRCVEVQSEAEQLVAEPHRDIGAELRPCVSVALEQFRLRQVSELVVARQGDGDFGEEGVTPGVAGSCPNEPVFIAYDNGRAFKV